MSFGGLFARVPFSNRTSSFATCEPLFRQFFESRLAVVDILEGLSSSLFFFFFRLC